MYNCFLYEDRLVMPYILFSTPACKQSCLKNWLCCQLFVLTKFISDLRFIVILWWVVIWWQGSLWCWKFETLEKLWHAIQNKRCGLLSCRVVFVLDYIWPHNEKNGNIRFTIVISLGYVHDMNFGEQICSKILFQEIPCRFHLF